MSSLDFTVYGVPIPQGSKRAFAHRTTGHVVMVDDNPKLKAWRALVHDTAALAVMGDDTWPCDGPVGVRLAFTFAKPASAPKTRRSYAHRTADIDKVTRAVLDSLSTTPRTKAGRPAGGPVLTNDARVIYLEACKRYPDGTPGALPRPGVRVQVWTIGASDAATIRAAATIYADHHPDYPDMEEDR